VYEDAIGVSVSRLELIDRSGKRRALGGAAQYIAPRFSPDGQRIAVAIQSASAGPGMRNGTSDLWIIDLSTNNPTRVTSTGAAMAPEWSADGRHLIYLATVRGRQEIWSTPLDGSAPPAKVTEIDGDVDYAVPTHDSRSLIVSRFAPGDLRLEMLRVAVGDTSRTEKLVSPTAANDVRPISPRVSPNGELVAFADRMRSSVHVRSLVTGATIQVSAEGGCCPLWAPDSRQVLFRNGDRLVTVDLETSPTLTVLRRSVSPGFWTASSTYDDVFYDISPDGRTFATVTPMRNDARIFVAFNWLQEMRREWQADTRK
jgi:Tol biopolymer transport system component